MNIKKLLVGLTIFLIGMLGILSMLTMDIPIPDETEALLLDRFSPFEIQLLLLVNPTILLLIAVVVGTILFQKVRLSAPIIERAVGIPNEDDVKQSIIQGISGGVIAGILLSLIGMIFTPILPHEFKELGEALKPTLASRILYGGFTEEIMMRFGLMTLIVWIISKVTNRLGSVEFWVGILLASLLFAVGHFPVAFQAVESPSAGLLTYILLGNTLGGIIFGWLYWKKGLEAAFLGHIFAHVIMVISEPLIN
ncbi:MAG: CPBP family intramembrane metalloprotease [Salibacteraceae bacterium]